MNAHQLAKRAHLLLVCLVLAGCATQDKQPDELPYKKNALVVFSDKGGPIQDAFEPLCTPQREGDSADQNKVGIAILAGQGFNYAYDDAVAAEAALYMSRKYAEALQEEIKRCGVPVEVYMNTNKAISSREHLGQALAQRKSDGLIQVSVAPERVDSRSALTISVDYFPLTWESAPDGYSRVVTGAKLSQKYKMAPNTILALYARKFATVLYEKGYIGD